MPNCKTANAVKLTTNVFRDVNIAFVNELSLLFEKLGIDTMTVLKAAQSKYNFQVHYPGAGVGGPCLPVNSYQLINSAKKLGGSLKVVESGRKINESMPQHVIDLTIDAFKEKNLNLKDSTILILGISYKPNVKDIQLSPANHIVTKLKNLNAKIKIFDPYYKSETIYGIVCENNFEDSLSSVDALILVTGHNEFKKISSNLLSSKMKNPIVIDTRGLLNLDEVKKSNLIFRGLGRGTT
jgi:nucleotide sugar dehydrogenase